MAKANIYSNSDCTEDTAPVEQNEGKCVNRDDGTYSLQHHLMPVARGRDPANPHILIPRVPAAQIKVQVKDKWY